MKIQKQQSVLADLGWLMAGFVAESMLAAVWIGLALLLIVLCK